MAQTIKVNGTPMLVSDDISFPFWLESGSSISPEVPVSSISVLEFNIVPNANGNDMVFNQVISVTEGQTVPEGKTWKVESILMENHRFGSSANSNSKEIQNAEYIANAESGLHIKFYEPYYVSELSSVLLYADILPGGGGDPQHGGFCYSTTNSSPDLNDECVYTANPNIGGQFYQSLNVGYDLISDSSYYVRAFVSNNSGVTFSNTFTFHTYPYFIGMKHGGGIVYYIDSTNHHGYVITEQNIGSYSFSCNSNMNTSSYFMMGESNTNSMIEHECNSSLFNFIDDGYLGYNDWFIPTSGDLYYMCETIIRQGDYYNPNYGYQGIDVKVEVNNIDYTIKRPSNVDLAFKFSAESVMSSTSNYSSNTFKFMDFSGCNLSAISSSYPIRLIRKF